MKIAILGKGCPKCLKLEENVRKAVELIGIEAQIEKITDIDQILEYGVMQTPALVINGEVKSIGRVLPAEEIAKILQGN